MSLTLGTIPVAPSDASLSVELRDPSSADFRLNPVGQETPVQGGLIVTVHSVDDLDAAWSFEWDQLTHREVELLDELYAQETLLMEDPLGLLTQGYISALDYTGLEGVTGPLGEQLYRASIDFTLTYLTWPDVLPELPAGEYPDAQQVGISVHGDRPIRVHAVGTGQTANVDEDGFLLCVGGQLASWDASSTYPANADDSWDRIARTRVATDWGHTVPARYLDLKQRALAPQVGSAFLLWRPMSGADILPPDATAAESLEQQWLPGDAGPHQRVLLGSGRSKDPAAADRTGWFLYALDTALVIEFWRGATLVASRALDLGDLGDLGGYAAGPHYVIAFGYDYTNGVISLGVAGLSASTSGHAYQTWALPELVDFGYSYDSIQVGGDSISWDENPASTTLGSATCWGRVKALQGQFSTPRFLTRGLLSRLATTMREQEESQERG